MLVLHASGTLCACVLVQGFSDMMRHDIGEHCQLGTPLFAMHFTFERVVELFKRLVRGLAPSPFSSTTAPSHHGDQEPYFKNPCTRLSTVIRILMKLSARVYGY